MAREDSNLRLEFAHLLLHFVCIRFANIRRIGDDEVELLIGISSQKVGLAETYFPFQSQASGVDAGNLQRFFRDIAGVNFYVRQLTGQCQGNASGASTNVKLVSSAQAHQTDTA